jgi:hypothetical protein
MNLWLLLQTFLKLFPCSTKIHVLRFLSSLCPHLSDHRTQKAKCKSTRFCPDPNHPSRNGNICRTVLLPLFLIVRLAKAFVNKFALPLFLNTDTLLCVCRHKKDTIKIAKKHTQMAHSQSHVENRHKRTRHKQTHTRKQMSASSGRWIELIGLRLSEQFYRIFSQPISPSVMQICFNTGKQRAHLSGLIQLAPQPLTLP